MRRVLCPIVAVCSSPHWQRWPAGLLGRRGRGRRAGDQECESGLEPFVAEDHRHALCGGGEAGAEPLRADSDRHQPGRLRTGRGARHRRPAVCDGAEEPPAGRESAEDRLSLPEDRAVWRQRAPGGRRLRGGDGALGHCRQGLQHPRLPDAGRQMARHHSHLCRYSGGEGSARSTDSAPESARSWG